ncbi:MAG: hypothetical protein P8X62_06905, partial [Flavobacteriaceae bacterium]
DTEEEVVNYNPNLYISNFFNSQNDAVLNNNPITNGTLYQNSIPQEIVFARVENQYGCFNIVETTLDISNNPINVQPYNVCDEDEIDGHSTFDLNVLRMQIQANVPPSASIFFFETDEDALNEANTIDGNYINTVPYNQTVYVKVLNNNQCYALTTVELNVLFTPELLPDDSIIYCLNSFPEFITLQAGILNDSSSNYTYQWFLDNILLSETTASINVTDVGIYSVVANYSNGCSQSRTITVNPSNVATITNVSVQ